MERIPCVRGKFYDYDRFKQALHALKESGIRRYEAFGPTELDGVRDLMPRKGSPVRPWATIGALVGLVVFYLMCALTAQIYNLIVGGKMPVAGVPYIVPAYEGTILVGSVMAFVAVLIYARFGDHQLPADYDPDYSRDTYGIHVYCGLAEGERAASILRDSGAAEIDEHA